MEAVKRTNSSPPDVIGLDIGAAVIKAALVRDEQLVLWGSTPTPPGSIVQGFVVDPAALAAALNRLWAEIGLDSRSVNLALSNGRCQLTLVSMVEPAEHRQAAIELGVKAFAEVQFSPLSLDKLSVDYRELTSTIVDSSGGQRLQLQLAAAERRMVADYLDMLKQAKLHAAGAELATLAAARAVLYPYSSTNGQLVIDIGAERTRVSVANAADVLFSRQIEIGGFDFTRAIARQLGIPFEEAETLKRAVGLHPGQAPAEFAASANAVADAMQAPVDRLTQAIIELRRGYEARPDSRLLTGFTLLGGASKLSGFAAPLATYLNLPGPATAELRPGLTAAIDAADYAVALGAAMPAQMSFLSGGARRSLRLGRDTARAPQFDLRRARGHLRRLKRRRRGTSPWLYAVLVAAAVFAVAFVGARQLIPATPASAQLAPAATIAAGPHYTGPLASPAAQQAADALAAQPGAAHLRELTELALSHQLGQLEISSNGNSILLFGRAPSDTAANSLTAALRRLAYADLQSTTGPTPATTGAQGAVMVGYTLIVKAGQ